MKKMLGLLVLLLVLIPFNIKALEDSEAPTLSKITFSTYTLTPGENVTIYVEGNDNLTGIANVGVELRLKSDHSKNFPLSASVTPGNIVSYTKQVPENVSPGEYEIYVVQVWDAAWNLNTYRIENENFPFPVTDVTVLDSGRDFTPPVLSNIVIAPQTTTYPQHFTISVEATDTQSAITQVSFIYKINGKIYNYNLEKREGNTWSTKAYVDERNVFSDAEFVTAYVYDAAGNSSKYDTDVSRDPYRNYKEIILTQNLDVVYTDKIIDTELPILKSCSYSSEKVSAPGSVTLRCNITDDKGISGVDIHFVGYDKTGKLIDYIVMYASYDKAKKEAYSTYTFQQYTPDASFSIEKVVITDIAGKTATYSIYEDDGNPNLEKKTLTLVQAVTSDETVSNINGDYVEKIEKLEEGKTITVDTTSNNVLSSNVFNSIKGKDKKVIAVNDGIQWIFDGKDIKNNIKDINTKIEVYKINDYGDRDYSGMFGRKNSAIVIEFANNGVLPGRALIKIKADYTLKDYLGIKHLFVYHVASSEEDELEAIAKEVYLGEDGYYSFYITHNSKYIISNTSAKSANVVKDSITELGNTDIPEIIVEDETTETEENEESVETTGESIAPNKKDEKKKTNYFYIIIPSVAGVLTLLLISTIIIKNKKKKNTNVPTKENNNKKEKSKIKKQK